MARRLVNAAADGHKLIKRRRRLGTRDYFSGGGSILVPHLLILYVNIHHQIQYILTHMRKFVTRNTVKHA